MKSLLGEFQEFVLMTVFLLDGQGYGVSIQTELSKRLDRRVSRGALHTALTRLEEKGMITSTMSDATAVRGGRRKRIYTITTYGKTTLEEIRDLRNQWWSSIGDLSPSSS